MPRTYICSQPDRGLDATHQHGADAHEIPFAPATLADWADGADPGSIGDALDELATTGGGSAESKIAYVTNPQAGSYYPLFMVPAACQLVRVFYQTDTGTVDFQLYRRTKANVLTTSGQTAIYSDVVQASSTQAEDTDPDDWSVYEFNGQDVIWLYIDAIASSPAEFIIGIEFKLTP
jgi:hypothetical protein